MTADLTARAWEPTGPPVGPPLVALPGLGVSRYLHAGCAHLARSTGRQVLLVEPPGFGANLHALEPPLSVAAAADLLRSWLAERGPVALVGQSTGCLLAARLAGADGVDCRSLALVGPVFDPAWSTVPRAALRLLRDGPGEPWWLGPSELPEWARHARRLPSYARSCVAERIEEHLDRVTCPVVVVRGDRDAMSRQAWAAGLADRPGRTFVTVPGAAHTFMADRPELLAEALSEAAR